MSATVRSLATLALALLTLTGLAAGQEVTAIVEDVAGHGDRIRVEGEGLSKKSKLVLVQDGELVKKTKLKVAEEGSGYVDVDIKKGLEGTFRIGLRDKKAVVGISPDTIELVPPQPMNPDPSTAMPGDEVTMMVAYYGPQGHQVRVGDKKAKIVDEQAVEGGGPPLTVVTFRVPKVADGVWPITVINRLGSGTLKNALEVVGGSGKPPKIGGTINIVGMKPFKPKKKLIGTDEGGGDPGEVNVGLVGGSKKKPQVFGIQMAGQIEDLQAGDVFDGSDGISSILYSVTGKKGSQCVWTTEGNEEGEDFAIQVISVSEDELVLFVCGKARLAEEISTGDCPKEVICFSGLVTAPGTPEDTSLGGSCEPLTTATGSSTGEFLGDGIDNEAVYGFAGPNVLLIASGTSAQTPGGVPLQVLSIRVTFNPATDATPATFDSLALDGSGLQGFALELSDGTIWTTTYAPQVPPTPASMSVTIDEVIPAAPNPFGILGCLRGSFTGTLTLTSVPEMPTQSFSGSFEIPWYSPTFGG